MLSCEISNVPLDAVADQARHLPVLCEGYAQDIFKTDDTGIFFRALPSKLMMVEGESCKGGKVVKDCVTVLLAEIAIGEKL